MIGQIVQSVKDNVSQALPAACWHNPSMTKIRKVMTPSEFEAAFVARTKALRQSKFAAAKDMAAALQIPAARYAKYETRNPMPHELLEPFALIVGVTVAYLVTGRLVDNKGNPPPPPLPSLPPSRRPRKGATVTEMDLSERTPAKDTKRKRA